MDKKNTEQNRKNENDGGPEKKKKNSSLASGLESMALVSQFGLTLAIPIVLGALAGRWIDEKLGTGMIFFLILFCLGIAGGFTAAYHQIIAVIKRKK